MLILSHPQEHETFVFHHCRLVNAACIAYVRAFNSDVRWFVTG